MGWDAVGRWFGVSMLQPFAVVSLIFFLSLGMTIVSVTENAGSDC